MLFAKPTRYGAGLTIWGDYYDLRCAHATITYFHDRSPMGQSLKEYTLALAYDIRHAYQRDRQIKKFGFDATNAVEYLGVNVLWPFYLTQIAIVRQQAAFVPNSEYEQAGLYLLENCARTALLEYDAEVGNECFMWLKCPHIFPDDYLTEYFNYIAKAFATEGRPGKMRFKRLPQILRSTSCLSSEYRCFGGHIQDVSIDMTCSPEQLSDWSEWPGFKW